MARRSVRRGDVPMGVEMRCSGQQVALFHISGWRVVILSLLVPEHYWNVRYLLFQISSVWSFERMGNRVLPCISP